MDPGSSSDPILQLLLFIQLPVCVYLGYRTATKSERSRLNWILIGCVASVLPIVGPVVMLVAALWMPPAMPRNPRRATSTRPGRHSPRRPGGGD